MEDKRQCPQCRTALKVPESAAGKAVRCPRCKVVIPAPAVAKATVEDERVTARRGAARAQEEEEPRRSAKAAGQDEEEEIDPKLLARGKKLSLRLDSFPRLIQGKVHEHLLPQERIVWVGRPHRGPRFLLLLLLVFIALAIGGLVLAVGLSYELPVLWAGLFAATEVGLFLLANVNIFYRLVFAKSVCYVLTSRRVLSCVLYPPWSFKRLLKGAEAFTYKEGPAAYPKKKRHLLFRSVGTLLMGPGICLPIQKFVGMTRISRRVRGVSGIGNIDEVEKLVHDTLQPRAKTKAIWPKPNWLFVGLAIVFTLGFVGVIVGVFAALFVFGGFGSVLERGSQRDSSKEATVEREKKSSEDRFRQVAWKARPDPGPALPTAGTKAIPASGGTVVFPGSPATFVAANLARNPKEYAVFDLSSGRQVGKTHALKIVDGTRPALSQDGQTLALRVEGRTDLVEVRDVERRNRPLHVPFNKDGEDGFTIGDLRFANKDRLLVVFRKGEAGRDPRTNFAVFNVTSKKHESHFSGSFHYEERRAALSPGGNFLVMHSEVDKNFLVFRDLRNGELAGTLEVREPADPEGETAGLAFSPDGKFLALLWKTKEKGWGRVMCWDLESRKRISNHTIEQAPPGADKSGSYSLQWLPDGNGWLLFGHTILDRDRGTVAGKVGAEPTGQADAERVVVGRGRVSRFVPGARPSLQFLDLPGQRR